MPSPIPEPLWKLNGTSFAELGLSNPQMSVRAAEADDFVVTLDAIRPVQSPLFDYDDPVAVTYGEQQFFAGAAVEPQITELRHTYKFLGPWQWLSRIMWMQDWKLLNGGVVSYVKVPRGAFGIKQGVFIKTDQQVRDVLDYVLSIVPGVFQIGTIEPSISILSENFYAATCEEVIRKMLRWMMCIPFFDYSTSPPTIHFKLKSSLSAVNLDAKDTTALPGGIQSLNLTPQYKLQVPCVVIYYTRVGSYDGRLEKIESEVK